MSLVCKSEGGGLSTVALGSCIIINWRLFIDNFVIYITFNLLISISSFQQKQKIGPFTFDFIQ